MAIPLLPVSYDELAWQVKPTDFNEFSVFSPSAGLPQFQHAEASQQWSPNSNDHPFRCTAFSLSNASHTMSPSTLPPPWQPPSCASPWDLSNSYSLAAKQAPSYNATGYPQDWPYYNPYLLAEATNIMGKQAAASWRAAGPQMQHHETSQGFTNATGSGKAAEAEWPPPSGLPRLLGTSTPLSDLPAPAPKKRVKRSTSNKRQQKARSQAKGGPNPADPEADAGDEPYVPDPEEWDLQTTTVMMRNIPSRYTVEELVSEMITKDFAGHFDFLYMPMDFKTKRNKGYAFVNLVSAADALDFWQEFNGMQLPKYCTRKTLQITMATTQGLEANIKSVEKEKHRIHNPWFRPMLFNTQGEEIFREEAIPL